MSQIETKRKITEVTEVSTAEMIQELGDTGTILVNGILAQQDYNPQLTGVGRIRYYDEMRLGDSTVRGALNVVKLPILNAQWYIKPSSQDDTDIEIKNFIEDQLLKNSNFKWNSLLREILTFCDYGNSIYEKVFMPIKDGDYSGKIGWHHFGHRLSKTILKWAINGNDPGITQLLPAGKVQPTDGNRQLTTIEIPRWKLMYFILDQEGSNYEGISLLRSAYKHWYYKDNYYKIDAVATERHGLGIPVVKSPPQAAAKDKAKAVQIAKNIRANSQLYADLPAGFSLEFVDMKSNTLKDPDKMILHHDRQISKCVLAEFIELGSQGSSGAYSLSATLADLFYLSEEYIARLVKDELQLAINELVDLNYGKQKSYPTLEFGNIGQVSLEALGKFLQQTTQSGVITPDRELERHVRQVAHLPEAIYLQEQEDGKDLDGSGKVGDIPTSVIDPLTGMPVKAPPVMVAPDKGKPMSDPKAKMREFVEDTEKLLKNVQKVIYAKEKRVKKA